MDTKELVSLKPQAGECIPWQEKVKELPDITGDKDLVEKIWKDNDALAYMYIWQVLLSF